MAKKALLGSKVRRLRRERSLTQLEMAKGVGISASYLNLIEHNQRPLTLPLLFKLSDLYGVDLQSFSQDDESRLLADLNELFGDPFFRDTAIKRDELNEAVRAAPAICQAILMLYHAYRNSRSEVQALGERLSDDSFFSTSTHELRTLLTSILSFSEILEDHENLEPEQRQRFIGVVAEESRKLATIMTRMIEQTTLDSLPRSEQAPPPLEELDDFIHEHSNHFPALEEAAKRLRSDAGLGSEETDPERRFGTLSALWRRLETGAPPESGLAKARSPVLSSRCFRLAQSLAVRHYSAELESLIAGSHLSSNAARDLAREVMANYVAAAVMMPYEHFLVTAQDLRYDLDQLTWRFGVSFEQACQRLSSLQRPDNPGIPLHFVRVDIAGNISKRFSASGLRIARYGGACPRLNLHSAFLTPGQTNLQVSQMPDGSTFFCLARSIVKAEGGHHSPKSHFAVGIGCDIKFAPGIVYADDINLANRSIVVPVGVSCRLCARKNCRQRAFPAILESDRS
ncbi:helix-turn-helix domain-containing protein [Pelagibius sp. Alg239-R121]|uniref:helix-turn-helix domain-containing protein n=1 Tax=Pelagibius sp. Alg239-R121 TaxID=2993448 RepID=UPI0024A7922D|nr:helix-turn-helix domain-containing protein [Pelagibius sp. Alg239-R121]